MSERLCSKPACTHIAVATLTFEYATSTAVIGPLSARAEPHAHDLCREHAKNFVGPNGWQVVIHASLA